MGARSEFRGRRGSRVDALVIAATLMVAGISDSAKAEDRRERPRQLEQGSAPSRSVWNGANAQLAQLTGEQRAFDIPAQSLTSALAQFGQQSGLQVTVDGALVRGLSAPRVSGTMTANQALQRLLAGSGLTYRIVGGTTVAIQKVENTGRPTVLGPITVLGSRRIDVPLSNVPSSISVVDREEIQKEQAFSSRVEDILSRRVPGFNPSENRIRGRTAQNFINGVPVNEQLRASFEDGLNFVAPDQLDTVEVSRGANSAYGFGSPGGIIALQTPRAESEELTLRTTLRESFNPHRVGGSHQTSLYQSASQIVGKFDYHVGGVIAYDGNEFDPDGNLALGFDNAALNNNGEEILGNLDGSFGLDLGDAGRLRLTGTFSHVNFIETSQLAPGVYREEFGSRVPQPGGSDSFREVYTVNLGYENPDIWGSALKLELFASDSQIQAHRTSSNRTVRDKQTNEYQGFRSGITSPLDVLYDGMSVTYGFDYLRNRFFRPAIFTDTGEVEFFVSPDVTLESYAPYGQVEIPVADFLLTGGVRREEYHGHAETAVGPGGITGGDIESFGLTLFNAGVVYFLNDNVDLYTTFSQGAEITQLGRAAAAASSADQVDAQPAKSNQYEIGVRGEWSDLSASLAAFYTESDLLSALQCDGVNPCTPLREPREFWGIEASADWRIDRQWGIGGVLGWQDGIRKTDTGDTRRISSNEIPPFLVTGYVDYSPFPWWRNTLQLNYRGARDPFGDSTAFGEGRVDDLLLVNVSAGFDVGPGELQLGVENLLNKKYTSIQAEANNSDLTWLPEEGTRVYVSYSVKW